MTAFKLSLILLVIYSVLLLPKIKFNNEVKFSGDAWQYQSMAVNFAAGQGLMKMGAVQGDYRQIYKFSDEVKTIDQPNLSFFISLGEKDGEYNFYRAPGYIVFLGTIYKLFGVNPAAVKNIQMLLIIFVAAFLPYIGWHFWKNSGIMAGVLAGIFFLKEYARSVPRDLAISYPGDIMAEPLIAFSLLIWILAFIFWQKRPKAIRAIGLGAITGLCLLIKGTNIFLPLLTGVYLWRKKTGLTTFIFGLVLTILPWSVYASTTSGKIIIISTQAETALLDNNNEYALDGGWHPEGYSLDNPDAFYSQPEIKSLPLPQKLLAFYLAYPRLIPMMISEKIRLGFGGFFYLTYSLILIAASIIPRLWLPASAGIIYLFFHPDLFNISRPLFRIDLLLLTTTALVAAKRKLDLPASLMILFLNYLLLAVIVLGWPRLNQVIDFVFMLVFFRYLLNSVKIFSHAD